MPKKTDLSFTAIEAREKLPKLKRLIEIGQELSAINVKAIRLSNKAKKLLLERQQIEKELGPEIMDKLEQARKD